MKCNTEISEKYYRLKYFYHIDSHTIVNKLKEKLSSSFDTTQTFQTILCLLRCRTPSFYTVYTSFYEI